VGPNLHNEIGVTISLERAELDLQLPTFLGFLVEALARIRAKYKRASYPRFFGGSEQSVGASAETGRWLR
jgi:hypothetical protein